MRLGFLTIADLRFGIDEATLDAFVGHPTPAFPSSSPTILKWGWELRGSRLMDPHCEWIPHLSSEIMFATGARLQSWQDLAPHTVEWEGTGNADNDLHASLYVFEHAAVTEGRVEFTREGDAIRMVLSGVTSVGWGEAYGSGLQLEVDVRFDAVTILAGRSSEADARTQVTPLLCDDELIYATDEYGVATLRSR